MATCKKCGAELEEGAEFCSNCGEAVKAEEEKPAEEAAPATEEPKAEEAKAEETKAEEPKAEEKKEETKSEPNAFDKLLDTKDTTSDYDAKDIESNKVMGVLAYLSWLVLIPLIAAKDSKFARYHCNQGLILAIAEIIAWVVFGLLSWIPYVGIIFAIIEWAISIVCFCFMIIGIIFAAQGQAKELPLIGKYKILK